jgi:hypothetical protein
MRRVLLACSAVTAATALLITAVDARAAGPTIIQDKATRSEVHDRFQAAKLDLDAGDRRIVAAADKWTKNTNASLVDYKRATSPRKSCSAKSACGAAAVGPDAAFRLLVEVVLSETRELRLAIAKELSAARGSLRRVVRDRAMFSAITDDDRWVAELEWFLAQHRTLEGLVARLEDVEKTAHDERERELRTLVETGADDIERLLTVHRTGGNK